MSAVPGPVPAPPRGAAWASGAVPEAVGAGLAAVAVPGLPPGFLSPMKGAGNTRSSLRGGRDRQGLARPHEGEPAARGRGDRGGDLDGPAGSASSPRGGSAVWLPHGTPGRFVRFSQFDSPQGGKQGKPR